MKPNSIPARSRKQRFQQHETHSVNNANDLPVSLFACLSLIQKQQQRFTCWDLNTYNI